MHLLIMGVLVNVLTTLCSAGKCHNFTLSALTDYNVIQIKALTGWCWFQKVRGKKSCSICCLMNIITVGLMVSRPRTVLWGAQVSKLIQ